VDIEGCTLTSWVFDKELALVLLGYYEMSDSQALAGTFSRFLGGKSGIQPPVSLMAISTPLSIIPVEMEINPFSSVRLLLAAIAFAALTIISRKT
jgi:hypothetical protein